MVSIENPGINVEKEAILLLPYARVSISRQYDIEHNIEFQWQKLLSIEKTGKYVLGKFFFDVGSAREEYKTCNRPGLKKAMRLATKIDAAIVVTSAGRFTRTAVTYGRFLSSGGVVRVLDIGFDASRISLAAAMYGTERSVEQRRRIAIIERKRAFEDM